MKPCIKCGEPSNDTRCEEHTLTVQKRPNIRGTERWRRLSARLRAMQPWCSSCGTSDDLTVDHIVPLAKGGDPYDVHNLTVLCRSHNSAKSDHNPVGRDPARGPSRPLGKA